MTIAGPNRAGYYNQYNQGKRSITMDLSKPEVDPDRARTGAPLRCRHRQLRRRSDGSLGLGYEKIRAQRPDVVMLSMSGYGQTGPLKGYVSYGPPAAATAGLFSLSGYEGQGPSEIGISYADPNAGIFGAVAVMMALLHRKRTGRGQYIESVATRNRAGTAAGRTRRIRHERHAAEAQRQPASLDGAA